MKPWEETWEAREVGGTWQVRMPEQPPHRAWLNVHPIGEMDCPHPDEAARARLAAAAPEMARLLVELSGGVDTSDGEYRERCPVCHDRTMLPPDGRPGIPVDLHPGAHSPDCRLVAVLRKAGVIEGGEG